MKKKALLKPSKPKAQVKGTKTKKSAKKPAGRVETASKAELQQMEIQRLNTELEERGSALTKLSSEYDALKTKHESEALACVNARRDVLILEDQIGKYGDRITELEAFIRVAISGTAFDFTAASTLLAK